jgi:hypothetical protein
VRIAIFVPHVARKRITGRGRAGRREGAEEPWPGAGNFADEKIETSNAIGILPMIGISAEF